MQATRREFALIFDEWGTCGLSLQLRGVPVFCGKPDTDTVFNTVGKCLNPETQGVNFAPVSDSLFVDVDGKSDLLQTHSRRNVRGCGVWIGVWRIPEEDGGLKGRRMSEDIQNVCGLWSVVDMQAKGKCADS